jgi:GT2 family glycosyltransferase
MRELLVSVIILNWNRKKDTSELIGALRKQTYKNFEVIVVDNASEDGSVEHIRRHYPDVRVVEAEVNFALYGFNLGMKEARGKYFLHLASDTIPDERLIEKQVEKLDGSSDLGVSCASTYDWGTKRYLGPNRAIHGDNKRGYKVTYFDGNGICLRREVFEKVGGYSREYFICLEELEWAVRILQAGFEIACFTDVTIYHKKSEVGGEYRTKLGFYYCRNWIWFYLKYLPWKVIPSFLRLHFSSFRRYTGEIGTMGSGDCFRGIVASLRLLPKFLKEREPVSWEILERVKADLFPNKRHLYVK